MNLGDISLGQVLYFHFTTRQFSTGTPITSASLAVSVYKDDSTTESTSGITTTFSGGFDSRAGLASVKIDTSSDGTFYASGHDFSVVVTAGTADSVSIIGEVVGYFSIQNRSALRPATAGRTLVVDGSGLADANAVKLGPTGAGTAQTARDIGASVLLSSGSGSGQILLASGQVTVGTNNDKTGYTVSTVTDKTGYSLTAAYDLAKTAAQDGDAMTLTAAYDAAKTAAQAGDTMKVSSGTGANQIDLTSGKVNVGKINGATVIGTGISSDLWRA